MQNKIIKSKTAVEKLVDWIRENSMWAVTYDKKKDSFIMGPDDAVHTVQGDVVITIGDGWTEKCSVEEYKKCC